jgi:argininosuccinate lyase
VTREVGEEPVNTIKGQRARSVRVLEDFAAEIRIAERRLEDDLREARDVAAARNSSEKAWIVMLAHQGIVSRADAAAILKAIEDFEREPPEPAAPAYLPSDSFSVWSLEKILTGRLD